MTTSNDRLDRIEALVEKNAKAIDELTNDIGRFNDRLDNYEQGMRWVIQLSFGLLISATVALIVSALTLLVKTVVGQ
jgi:tetrahydromethanopterin S-methyltransferase subunit B